MIFLQSHWRSTCSTQRFRSGYQLKRKMLHDPYVADVVEAAFDIPLQYPSRGMGLRTALQSTLPLHATSGSKPQEFGSPVVSAPMLSCIASTPGSVSFGSPLPASRPMPLLSTSGLAAASRPVALVAALPLARTSAFALSSGALFFPSAYKRSRFRLCCDGILPPRERRVRSSANSERPTSHRNQPFIEPIMTPLTKYF